MLPNLAFAATGLQSVYMMGWWLYFCFRRESEMRIWKTYAYVYVYMYIHI